MYAFHSSFKSHTSELLSLAKYMLECSEFGPVDGQASVLRTSPLMSQFLTKCFIDTFLIQL